MIMNIDEIVDLCYTLQTDNIQETECPPMTPFLDRTAAWQSKLYSENSVTLCNSDFSVTCCIRYEEHLARIEFMARGKEPSEAGLLFHLDFIGKKGGDYRRQLMPNALIHSSDRRITAWFLDSSEGTAGYIGCARGRRLEVGLFA